MYKIFHHMGQRIDTCGVGICEQRTRVKVKMSRSKGNIFEK